MFCPPLFYGHWFSLGASAYQLFNRCEMFISPDDVLNLIFIYL